MTKVDKNQAKRARAPAPLPKEKQQFTVQVDKGRTILTLSDGSRVAWPGKGTPSQEQVTALLDGVPVTAPSQVTISKGRGRGVPSQQGPPPQLGRGRGLPKATGLDNQLSFFPSAVSPPKGMSSLPSFEPNNPLARSGQTLPNQSTIKAQAGLGPTLPSFFPAQSIEGNCPNKELLGTALPPDHSQASRHSGLDSAGFHAVAPLDGGPVSSYARQADTGAKTALSFLPSLGPPKMSPTPRPQGTSDQDASEGTVSSGTAAGSLAPSLACPQGGLEK